MRTEALYATYEYDESENDLVMDCALYLDQNAKYVYDFFGIEPNPKDKAAVHIIPTKKEFDEIYRRINKKDDSYEVPSWVIGIAPDEIYSLSINDYKSTSHAFAPSERDKAVSNYKKTLVHEFVHFVHKRFNEKHGQKYGRAYLSEGLACSLAEQYAEKQSSFSVSVEDFLKGNATYNQYKMAMDYMLNNYGRDFVLELLLNNDKADEFVKSELYDKLKESYGDKTEKPI